MSKEDITRISEEIKTLQSKKEKLVKDENKRKEKEAHDKTEKVLKMFETMSSNRDEDVFYEIRKFFTDGEGCSSLEYEKYLLGNLLDKHIQFLQTDIDSMTLFRDDMKKVKKKIDETWSPMEPPLPKLNKDAECLKCHHIWRYKNETKCPRCGYGKIRGE